MTRPEQVEDTLLDFLDKKQFNSFEGPRGVERLKATVKALDSNYSDVEEFLMDNSGCIEAILKWIGRQRSDEWLQGLQRAVKAAVD